MFQADGIACSKALCNWSRVSERTQWERQTQFDRTPSGFYLSNIPTAEYCGSHLVQSLRMEVRKELRNVNKGIDSCQMYLEGRTDRYWWLGVGGKAEQGFCLDLWLTKKEGKNEGSSYQPTQEISKEKPVLMTWEEDQGSVERSAAGLYLLVLRFLWGTRRT